MAKWKPNALQRNQEHIAWMFVVPTLAVVLGVGLYPLISTFYFSFTNATASPEPPDFVGLANYRELFGQKAFWESVLNTLIFAVSSVSLEFLFGLFFALIVNSEFKGRGGMRAAMLIPWALPTVVAARIWGLMLNDQFGVINDLLIEQTGLLGDRPVWTLDRGLALTSVVLVDVWKTTPFVALILLAGLQLIPGDIYEAADVDGANPVQQFFTITLPLLKPAILVALIFRTLDALRVFDVIWVLTKGRAGTESMATYNYRNLFDYLRIGYGSAISVMIFVIIAIFVVLYVWAMRVEEEPS